VIDHVNIGVSDLAACRAFYARALAPLGYAALMDRPYGVGFGKDGKPDFWISDRPPSTPHTTPRTTARTCSIPTATTSRPSATGRSSAIRSLRRRNRHPNAEGQLCFRAPWTGRG
jgi:catechol 2,3-dioxygenase-like lactoylglutathione lyase family enzyme